ncbi:MAG: protein kinase [Phycisphaeraceae bacterium]|nr:protein kinase [Phycisphaeraceae bacterium]
MSSRKSKPGGTMDGDMGRLRAIFDEAMETTPERRSEVITTRCGEDAALRRLVEAMVSAALNGDGFMSDTTRTRMPTAGGGPAERLAEGPGTRIGQYKLLQQIGEGGFGVVFMAEQERPVVRRVALKIIKLGMDTKQVVARFEQERQALAMMDHPNIARVLDAGSTETGRPYFVMELVKGVPITEYCDANHLTTRERLELFDPVCRAVQHAHQKGVIHRDLKPSNILVTLHDGVPVPKVIDFGIAKATNARLTERTLFTEHRAMIGTPAYMSPEQAEMSGLDVDTRSDVYSLGVLLYELLTGTTPFKEDELKAAGYAELQRIIREVEPQKPSTRASTLGDGLRTIAARRRIEPERLGTVLRGDLDWIVMKALEKDRRRRYETASDLAADVRRHLAGEPVVAAPPSAAYRFRKFARKYRGPVAACVAVAGALVLGVVGTGAGFLRESQQREVAETALRGEASARASERGQREIAEQAREIALTAQRAAERQAYTANVLAARASMADFQFGRARERLLQCVETERNFEWRYLFAEADASKFTLRGGNPVFSPDGTRILTCGSFGVRVWDAATGRELGTLRTPRTARTCEFSPDGTRILTAYGSPYVAQVWDSTTFELVVTCEGHDDYVNMARFSPDGSRVVTAADDATARVWDAATGNVIWQLTGHEYGYVYYAVFSPDGSRVATAGSDGTARLWDVATGTQVRVLEGHTSHVYSAIFSSDGRRLLTKSANGTARVWDASTGKRMAVLTDYLEFITDASFSPDGRRVLTSSDDGTAVVWDVDSGSRLLTLADPADTVWSACFSADGSMIVTESERGQCRIWDAVDGRLIASHFARSGELSSSQMSPDGSLIAVSDETVTDVFNIDRSVNVRRRDWPLATHVPCTASFLSLSDRIISTGPDSLVRLWSVSDGSHVADLLPDRHVTRVIPSCTGERLLVVANPFRDGVSKRFFRHARDEIWLVDAATGENALRLEEAAPSYASPAFSDDGTLAVSLSNSGQVSVWDAVTGDRLATLGPALNHDDLLSARISPANVCVVAMNASGYGVVWNLETGEEVARVLPVGSYLQSFAEFSPDGERLVVSSRSLAPTVLSARTGEPQFTIEGHAKPLRSAKFSKDGSRLTTSDGSTSLLWDVDKGIEIMSGSVCEALTFARDVKQSDNGSLVAAELANGTVGIYDAVTGFERCQISLSGQAINFLAFSADAKHAATSTEDGSVQLWHIGGLCYRVRDWPLVGPSAQASSAAFDADVRRLAVFWGTGGKILDLVSSVGGTTNLTHTSSTDFQPSFSDDGTRLIARGSDGNAVIAVWDASSGAEFPSALSELRKTDSVRSALYSEDLSHVIATTVRGVPILIDCITGERLAEFWSVVPVQAVAAASGDGLTVITAVRRDGRAQVWNAAAGEEILRLMGHLGGVRAVAMAPDGTRSVTSSGNGVVSLWDSEGNKLRVLAERESATSALAISPDSSRIIAGAQDGGVRLWFTDSERVPVTLPGHAEAILSASFSPDGETAVTASADAVRLWDANDGSPIAVLVHDAAVRLALFDPTGRLIATGSEDGEVRLWNAKTGERERQIAAGSAARCVAFTPEGSRVLIGNADGTAQVIDVTSEQRISVLTGHADEVTCAAISPDGTRVLTGSKDRSLRLWDAVRGEELMPFAESKDVFVQVWFTPDGRRIVALAESGSVVTWDSEPDRFDARP